MKKLKYVSLNTRKLYKELILYRDSYPVRVPKRILAQISAIERMEVYLSPKKLSA